MRYRDNGKKKIRAGAAIGLQELKEDKDRSRELVTELAMLSGYVGFIDHEEAGLRIFIFKTDEDADAMLREAKHMKYRTAGRVESFLAVANNECERPHLQYMPKRRYYSELYK